MRYRRRGTFLINFFFFSFFSYGFVKTVWRAVDKYNCCFFTYASRTKTVRREPSADTFCNDKSQ